MTALCKTPGLGLTLIICPAFDTDQGVSAEPGKDSYVGDEAQERQ